MDWIKKNMLVSHSNLLLLDISVLVPDVLVFEHEEPGIDQARLLLLMKVTEPAVIVWKRKKEKSETNKTHRMVLSNTNVLKFTAANLKHN